MSVENLSLRHLFIISEFDLFYQKSAAGNRMSKYAKAVADARTRVYLFPARRNPIKNKGGTMEQFFPNCWYVHAPGGKKLGPIRYLCWVKEYCNSLQGEKAVLVYPTNRPLLELLALLMFGLRSDIQVFLELNERRIFYKDASVFYKQPAGRRILIGIKFIYTKIAMTFGEMLIPFYNGAIIISTNLESFYKSIILGRTRVRYARVPILCEPGTNNAALPKFDGKEFRIGFAGQIRVRKENLDMLIRAIGRASRQSGVRIVLNLLGPAIDETTIRYESSRNGLAECVNFLGNLPHEEMKRELRTNHILALVRGNTAQNRYGFSTKLGDYLELGIPILATEVSDVSAYLTDNLSAFLVKPDDVDALTSRLLEIICNYSRLAVEVSEHALSVARNQLCFESYRESLQSLFFRT